MRKTIEPRAVPELSSEVAADAPSGAADAQVRTARADDAHAKTSRVDDAHARIKDEILANRMPPGLQATEPEIAAELGMSRTPVREALIRLEAEGLVQLRPRHGAHVLPIEPDDMREIYEILTALEPEAAASLAARRPTPEQLAPMAAATAASHTALCPGNQLASGITTSMSVSTSSTAQMITYCVFISTPARWKVLAFDIRVTLGEC